VNAHPPSLCSRDEPQKIEQKNYGKTRDTKSHNAIDDLAKTDGVDKIPEQPDPQKRQKNGQQLQPAVFLRMCICGVDWWIHSALPYVEMVSKM
jgi:hypothetical protein